jgi:hypothetical protein
LAGHPIESLEALLRALARERSLRGRLRVLGHSWKLLRSLTPAEREKVALRLGSNWAWRRLEKSFLRDGDLDETEQFVGRVFERLGDADPKELRKLASMVRSGDRQGAEDLLLLTLQEALEEEATLAEAQPPDNGPSVEEVSDEPPLAAYVEHTLEPTPERRPLAESAPEPELVDTASDVLTSSMARLVEPGPAVAPRVEVTPEALPRSLSEPTPSSDSDAARHSTQSHSQTAAGGAEKLRVLRALDVRGRAGADLGREGRARLVESLGGGWASRRALSRMIAAGALEDLEEALHLIGRLTRQGQRTWCLADLIETGGLDDESLGSVLEAAPTDAARRRLSRRVTERSSIRG